MRYLCGITISKISSSSALLTRIELVPLKTSHFDFCFSLQDKYKRALAETENVRMRFTKQLNDTKLYSISGFCKDLLEVADILGRATSSVPQEALEGSDANAHLKSLYEGLVMTESQLQKVLCNFENQSVWNCVF